MSTRSSRKAGSRTPRDVMRQPGSGLGQLLETARLLDRIDRCLDQVLDPEWMGKVRCASVTGDRLLLITPSATLASRLRMDADSLRKALWGTGKISVAVVEVRVGPIPENESSVRRQRELSPEARRFFAQLASDEDES